MKSVTKGFKSELFGKEPECQHIAGGKFCPQCGKQLEVSSIATKDVLDGFVAGWLQKGFRQTLIGLFVAPGRAVRTYLHEDRSRLIKPVAYLTLTAAFALWAHSLSGDIQCDVNDNPICHFVLTHLVYAQLMQALFVALAFWLVFSADRHQTFWELVTLNMFLLSQCFVISGIFSLLFWATPAAWVMPVSTGVRYVFFYTALLQFYEAKSINLILRVTAAYIAGLVSFFVVFSVFVELLVSFPAV